MQKKKKAMLDFKARCPAEVRWRCRKVHSLGSFAQSALRTMLGRINDLGTSLWDSIWGPLLQAQALLGWDAAKINSTCIQFLVDARVRSLEFKNWGKGLSEQDMDNLLDLKELFFEHLPETAVKKFEKTIKDTFVTKYEAVKGLIDLHNGENVDVHMSDAHRWTLLPLNTSLLEDLPEQFELGDKYTEPALTQYDMNVLSQHMVEVSASCRWQTPDTDLRPNFPKQLNRLVVPCKGTPYYCWVRSGRVISLGELFLQMHTDYNARDIYELYLHLEIVSVKRKKPASKRKSKSWA